MITRIDLWQSNPHPLTPHEERGYITCYLAKEGWELEDLIDSHEVRISRGGVSIKIYKAHVKCIIEEPEPVKAKGKRA